MSGRRRSQTLALWLVLALVVALAASQVSDSPPEASTTSAALTASDAPVTTASVTPAPEPIERVDGESSKPDEVPLVAESVVADLSTDEEAEDRSSEADDTPTTTQSIAPEPTIPTSAHEELTPPSSSAPVSGSASGSTTWSAPSQAQTLSASGSGSSPPSPAPTESESPAESPSSSALTIDAIASPSPMASSAPFLSFQEWREQYVAAVDPSPPRRQKKANQRARQDASGQANAGVNYDGDGSDFGSLFAAGEDSPGSADEFVAARPKSPGVDRSQIVAEVAKAPVSSSPIQPLANVGTGGAMDPLTALKDRSNYAAFECAAMVHNKSPKSKGASAILVEKKDRYMLTPCSASPQFVEIELCDEIQIETVVLANFEFFSGTFKHFSLQCSQDYPTREWEDLGTFRARNVRGVQVFKPAAPSNFCRYVRIEFTSHYGSEFYCPLSLVRVYGYTQMDAYRKEAMEKARRERIEAMLLDTPEEDDLVETEVPSEIHVPSTDSDKTSITVAASDHVAPSTSAQSPASDAPAEQTASATSSPQKSTESAVAEEEGTPTSATSASASSKSKSNVKLSWSDAVKSSLSLSTTKTLSPSASASSAEVPEPSSSGSDTIQPSPSYTSVEPIASTTETSSAQLSSSSTSTASSVSSAATEASSSSTQSSASSSTSAASVSSSSSASAEQSTTASSTPASISGATSSSTSSRTEPTVIATRYAPRNDTKPPPRPAPNPPPVGPGESIYGTIMKRLGSVEHDQALAMHYIDAQSAMLRDAFSRLEARLVEIEAAREGQEALVRQATVDLTKTRLEIARERGELSVQVRQLAKEVLIEKRLSIAELVGLLALVLFVGLTRGSPTTPLVGWVSKEASWSARERKERDKLGEAPAGDHRRMHLSPRPGGSTTPFVRLSSATKRHSLSLAKPAPSPLSHRRHHYQPSPAGSANPNLLRSPRPWTPPGRRASGPSPTEVGALERLGSGRKKKSSLEVHQEPVGLGLEPPSRGASPALGRTPKARSSLGARPGAVERSSSAPSEFDTEASDAPQTSEDEQGPLWSFARRTVKGSASGGEWADRASEATEDEEEWLGSEFELRRAKERTDTGPKPIQEGVAPPEEMQAAAVEKSEPPVGGTGA